MRELAQKFLNVQMSFLLKQNACCSLSHRSLSKTSLMSMANGWMAGKPVASATRAMIGPSLNLLLRVKSRHSILIRLFLAAIILLLHLLKHAMHQTEILIRQNGSAFWKIMSWDRSEEQ